MKETAIAGAHRRRRRQGAVRRSARTRSARWRVRRGQSQLEAQSLRRRGQWWGLLALWVLVGLRANQYRR